LKKITPNIHYLAGIWQEQAERMTDGKGVCSYRYLVWALEIFFWKKKHFAVL